MGTREIHQDPVGVNRDPASTPAETAAAAALLDKIRNVDPEGYRELIKNDTDKKIKNQEQFAHDKELAEKRITAALKGENERVPMLKLITMYSDDMTMAELKQKAKDYVEDNIAFQLRGDRKQLAEFRTVVHDPKIPKELQIPEITEDFDDAQWENWNTKVAAVKEYTNNLERSISEQENTLQAHQDVIDLLENYVLDDDITVKEYMGMIQERDENRRVRENDEYTLVPPPSA